MNTDDDDPSRPECQLSCFDKNIGRRPAEYHAPRKVPLLSRAVRPIPKSSKGHFVAELVFNRGNEIQRLGCASELEYNAALCLIYRSGFVDLEEQLAPLPYTGIDGKVHDHYFDFRLSQTSGRRICVSVKPEQIAETAVYKANFRRIRQAAVGSICDAAITVTERNISPVALHNAKLFHAARDPQPEIDQLLLAGLPRLTHLQPISEFLDAVGINGHGFFAVARAIRMGKISLFQQEEIHTDTLIFCGKAA